MIIRTSARRVGYALLALLAGGLCAIGILVDRTQAAVEKRVAQEVEMRQFPWAEDLERWVLPATLDEFGTGTTQTGNAALLLWPSGLSDRSVSCPRYVALGPRAPADSLQAQAAGRCAKLDVFRRASHTGKLDLLEVASEGDAEALLLKNAVFSNVRSGINALIASAQLLEASTEYAAAEAELRSAMSLALLLLRQSASPAGMEVGHSRMMVVLEHFEELFRRQQRIAEAEKAASLRKALPPFESCRSVLSVGLPRSGAVDTGLPFIAAVARRSDLPLGMRIRALYVVQHGHYASPLGMLIGRRSRVRREVLDELREDQDIGRWLEPVRQLSAPKPRDRIAQLAEYLVSGHQW